MHHWIFILHHHYDFDQSFITVKKLHIYIYHDSYNGKSFSFFFAPNNFKMQQEHFMGYCYK